jgi:hypothetical protein
MLSSFTSDAWVSPPFTIQGSQLTRVDEVALAMEIIESEKGLLDDTFPSCDGEKTVRLRTLECGHIRSEHVSD